AAGSATWVSAWPSARSGESRDCDQSRRLPPESSELRTLTSPRSFVSDSDRFELRLAGNAGTDLPCPHCNLTTRRNADLEFATRYAARGWLQPVNRELTQRSPGTLVGGVRSKQCDRNRGLVVGVCRDFARVLHACRQIGPFRE